MIANYIYSYRRRFIMKSENNAQISISGIIGFISLAVIIFCLYMSKGDLSFRYDLRQKSSVHWSSLSKKLSDLGIEFSHSTANDSLIGEALDNKGILIESSDYDPEGRELHYNLVFNREEVTGSITLNDVSKQCVGKSYHVKLSVDGTKPVIFYKEALIDEGSASLKDVRDCAAFFFDSILGDVIRRIEQDKSSYEEGLKQMLNARTFG